VSTACDFLVIGGGIAGLSVAARLAPDAKVVLLEREEQLAYHTTGRSAAMFLEAYGPEEMRQFTTASRDEYENGLQQDAASLLLTPKPVFNIATAMQMDRFRAMVNDPVYQTPPEALDAQATLEQIPLLKPGFAEASYAEPDAREIDVHELLQVFTRRFRDAGGQSVTRAQVTEMSRSDNLWRVKTTAGEFSSPIVVNAAGAWADQLAQIAGANPLGLVPKRRTIAVVDRPANAIDVELPFVADVDESFYIKPETGRLLLSPADETPVEPMDAQPEALDVAVAIDRVETAFELEFETVQHAWSGLRSFFPDGVPVCGFDPQASGFFWLAGQGGYGIQTAPALSSSDYHLNGLLPVKF